ncbi:MAG: bifunctional ADP-heptose synthase [Anaerolineae bacterium]
MSDDLVSLIHALSGLRVLVVGDVILDEYLIGRATRLSREAPIPVLEFEERRLIPGGAANPAANIVALGSTAVQLGVMGADTDATALREVLHARGIDASALVVDGGRSTTVKTRVMAQMGLRFPQQVARIDRLSRAPLPPAVERQVRDLMQRHAQSVRAILFSDYHAGLLSRLLVDAGRQLARDSGALLTADAQGELEKYAGFDVVKCNADEARAYLHRPLHGDDDFAAAADELAESLGVRRAMVITRGADGATLAVPGDGEHHCRAPLTTEVFDTVGAGDTAIAVLTLAMAAGASPVGAATLANIASGLVVRRVGNYAPTPDELVEAVRMIQ